MFLTFLICVVFWSGIGLYRSSGRTSINWQEPPKLVIAYISLVLSFLSVLLLDFYQPITLANESTWYYLPLSYPLGVRFYTSQNMKMSNWLLWFLTPEFNWTLSLPGFIPFQTNLISFLISLCFFSINYFFTVSLLKYLYSRRTPSSSHQGKIVYPSKIGMYLYIGSLFFLLTAAFSFLYTVPPSNQPPLFEPPFLFTPFTPFHPLIIFTIPALILSFVLYLFAIRSMEILTQNK